MPLKLKRIAPGYYETLNGRYCVKGGMGYDEKGWVWHRNVAGPKGYADDVFATKAEAVEALEDWIKHHPEE